MQRRVVFRQTTHLQIGFWSFCNVYLWIHLKKSLFEQNKYTKDGFSSLRTFFSFAERENRLLCICVYEFGLKKSQPEGRSRVAMGSHRDWHAHQGSLGGLKGAKHDGIRGKSSKSLWECIDFHKRTIYSIDAAEQQRLYILCHLKKPAKSSIQAHVTRMETLNKYLKQLPTIKNS